MKDAANRAAAAETETPPGFYEIIDDDMRRDALRALRDLRATAPNQIMLAGIDWYTYEAQRLIRRNGLPWRDMPREAILCARLLPQDEMKKMLLARVGYAEAIYTVSDENVALHLLHKRKAAELFEPESRLDYLKSCHYFVSFMEGARMGKLRVDHVIEEKAALMALLPNGVHSEIACFCENQAAAVAKATLSQEPRPAPPGAAT